jgi:hypothetical protein
MIMKIAVDAADGNHPSDDPGVHAARLVFVLFRARSTVYAPSQQRVRAA